MFEMEKCSLIPRGALPLSSMTANGNGNQSVVKVRFWEIKQEWLINTVKN